MGTYILEAFSDIHHKYSIPFLLNVFGIFFASFDFSENNFDKNRNDEGQKGPFGTYRHTNFQFTQNSQKNYQEDSFEGMYEIMLKIQLMWLLCCYF